MRKLTFVKYVKWCEWGIGIDFDASIGDDLTLFIDIGPLHMMFNWDEWGV